MQLLNILCKLAQYYYHTNKVLRCTEKCTLFLAHPVDAACYWFVCRSVTIVSPAKTTERPRCHGLRWAQFCLDSFLCMYVFCAFSALMLLVGQQEGHPACKNMRGWWTWALVSPDGVTPSRIVDVSASVNLSLHHKVQKFSSSTGSPGWSRKKDRKTVVVVCILCITVYCML